MMLTRFVRIQLTIFAILTVVGLVVMSLMYVKLPALFGIGRYEIVVELQSTGGLYPHSNVTYRGNTVGTVRSVACRRQGRGVAVHRQRREDSRRCGRGGAQRLGCRRTVRRSRSPSRRFGRRTPGRRRRDPDRRTSVPQEVGALLDQADVLLASISDTRLQTVVDEAFDAFNGSGPNCRN